MSAELATDRSTTRAGIAIGMLGGVALYALGYALWPDGDGAATAADRLAYAAWLGAIPAVVVYAMFFACLRLRDTPEAVDPLRGGESLRWKVNQRVLTNTVEQLAIFYPLHLALAARVDAAHARLIPLHVACWTFARIAFWIGYRRAPAWRAPGMSFTHLVSLIAILWLARFTFA